MGALQFFALLASGFFVYAVLADTPYCEACAKYAKELRTLKLAFGGDMTVIDELRKSEAMSSIYFESLRRLPVGSTAALELVHSRCPGCTRETVTERPMFSADGKLSYKHDACRTSWGALGVSVDAELARIQAVSSRGAAPEAV